MATGRGRAGSDLWIPELDRLVFALSHTRPAPWQVLLLLYQTRPITVTSRIWSGLLVVDLESFEKK